jgi:hypothetical protein
MFWKCGAGALLAGLVTAAAAQAQFKEFKEASTFRLGEVPAADRDLDRDRGEDGDTERVHRRFYGGHRYGGFGWGGYGWGGYYRPFYRSGFSLSLSFGRPYYGGYGWGGYYRPFYGHYHRPFFGYGGYNGYGYGGYYSYFRPYYYPSLYYSSLAYYQPYSYSYSYYQPYYYSSFYNPYFYCSLGDLDDGYSYGNGSTPHSYPSPSTEPRRYYDEQPRRMPRSEDRESPPPPRDNGTYRYDGGPSDPVPMPKAEPEPTERPVPAPRTPAEGRIVSLPGRKPEAKTRFAYPAYGEKADYSAFAKDRTLPLKGERTAQRPRR